MSRLLYYVAKVLCRQDNDKDLEVDFLRYLKRGHTFVCSHDVRAALSKNIVAVFPYSKA